MIKKFIIFIGNFLFAYQEVYFYNVYLDYKEYSYGIVIDRDFTKFGELVGVGYKYKKRKYDFLSYGFAVEYASGNSYYDGATQGGEPVFVKQNGVYIFNTNAFVKLYPFYFILGYRVWNRGKSNYEGDYNERYYWWYAGFWYSGIYNFRHIKFTPEFNLLFAINPKMKLYLGNSPTLNLGDTGGAKIEFPFSFKINKDLAIKFFYRVELWSIDASDTYTLIYQDENGEEVEMPVFEPSSLTINQYLGLGILFNF